MVRPNNSPRSFAHLSERPKAHISFSSSTARRTLAAAAVLLSGSLALAQNVLPDSQVEANVLKALAGAPDLATENITTRTNYGTVTLSGSVSSEALRTRAENLAANAAGVKKVVDELTLGTSAQSAGDAGPGPGMVLQSDGSYAPADAAQVSAAPSAGQPVRNDPENDQALDQQMEPQQNGQSAPATNPGGYPQPSNPPQGYPQNGYPQAQTYPQQTYPPQNYPPQTYPQQTNQSPYPGQPYPQQSQQQYPQQPGYNTHGYAAPADGGQQGGEVVTIPSGTLLRLRINQPLASNHSRPGESFDGIIINDIVSGGSIAVPRGAAVRGTVVDAKESGVLKGRGEITLQLTQVTLAGKTYPIVSDSWEHNGADKTVDTVNRTVGLGAFGALIGAVAGGGAGAAIGAGAGAAAGLGSSAASGRGQVFIPAEAVLTFHLAQPVTVTTVSEQEMQRLAYGVPANGGNPQMQRRNYPRPYGYPPPPPYGYPY